VSGSDVDGDPITYSIAAGNSDGVFGMSGDELVVDDVTNLDFESTMQYTLTIRGGDGVNTGVAMVLVDVVNINDNVPLIDNAFASIDEDASSGEVVTIMSGSDADGDSIVYSIISGNIDSIFGMSGDQLIVVDTTNLDYEATT
jgi:hypothetical protein